MSPLLAPVWLLGLDPDFPPLSLSLASRLGLAPRCRLHSVLLPVGSFRGSGGSCSPEKCWPWRSQVRRREGDTLPALLATAPLLWRETKLIWLVVWLKARMEILNREGVRTGGR